jgi:hypothetical protein
MIFIGRYIIIKNFFFFFLNSQYVAAFKVPCRFVSYINQVKTHCTGKPILKHHFQMVNNSNILIIYLSFLFIYLLLFLY